jgi:hypothetical protein
MLAQIGGGKNFELSLIELLGYGTIVICIYRTSDGKFYIFLNRLGLIIQKLIVKNKILILSGEWNINFLQKSFNARELNIIFWRYHLKHTVSVPPTVTKSTSTLLDIMIIYKKISCNPQ